MPHSLGFPLFPVKKAGETVILHMILGIIPARYASSRFPGKPLAEIEGKTMIQRVYEQCKKADKLSSVIVATDDVRIFQHVQSFGGEVEMTDPAHPSGTDRIAEIAARQTRFSHVINIQGDEPLINPAQIDQLCTTLTQASEPTIATLIKRIDQTAQLHSPHVVKTVIDHQGYALYFSRSPIPYSRAQEAEASHLQQYPHYQHLGIYGFQRKILLQLAQLDKTNYEKIESLEQLRWLESGYRIKTAVTTLHSYAVDTPEDLEIVRKLAQESP